MRGVVVMCNFRSTILRIESYMKIIFIFILLASCVHIHGQERRLSPSEAKEDICYYFSTLNQIHPNMYWSTSKEIIDSCCINLCNSITDSIDTPELSAKLQKFNYFFDGHTGIYSRYYDFFLKKADYRVFPEIIINENGLFLKTDNTKIQSINGVQTDRLLELMRQRFPCDILNERFYWKSSNALNFQMMLIEEGIMEPFVVQIETDQHKDSLLTMERGMSVHHLYREVMEFDSEAFALSLHKEHNVAIIYFNQCVLHSEGVELDSFLNDCFEKIKTNSITNLFIDISQNGGGTTRACECFLKYIDFNRSFTYKTCCCYKNHVTDSSFVMDTMTFNCSNYPNNFSGYNGNLFVCYGYKTSSAAPHLACVLKAGDRAILVGSSMEPTLPLYTDMEPFYLPYSHIPFSSSFKYFFYEDPVIPRNAQGSIIPDIGYDCDDQLNLNDCFAIIDLFRKK